MTKQPSMHSRTFGSKEALIAYAKQNGFTCLSASFAKWQQLLSPKEYLLVEVLTSDGMRPAMLLPKATLKAAWEADPLRKALARPSSAIK
jgi:hypothetical protein